jgi:hypothetical protein
MRNLCWNSGAVIGFLSPARYCGQAGFRMSGNMDFTWALAAASFLSGGAGAYLGSYLKKKGENLATHEDIDELVDQVRAVTTTTKEIEAKISNQVWDRQKQWELKREVLFDAARRLPEIDSALLGLSTFWNSRNGEGNMDEATRVTLEHNYVTAWHKASKSFEETTSLIQVTCSKETMVAFAEVGDLMRRTAAKITNDDMAIYSGTKEERNKKFAMARVVIRKELGIGFDVAPQSGVSLAAPSAAAPITK